MLAFSPVFTVLLVLAGALMASAAPIEASLSLNVHAPGTYVEAYAGKDCAGMPTASYYLEFINRVRNLDPAMSIRSSPETDDVVLNMFAGDDASGTQVGTIKGRQCTNTNGAKVQSVQLVV